VAGSGDILAIGVKLHGEADLGDELAYLRANYAQCGKPPTPLPITTTS
jgi:hypothetical protein